MDAVSWLATNAIGRAILIGISALTGSVKRRALAAIEGEVNVGAEAKISPWTGQFIPAITIRIPLVSKSEFAVTAVSLSMNVDFGNVTIGHFDWARPLIAEEGSAVSNLRPKADGQIEVYYVLPALVMHASMKSITTFRGHVRFKTRFGEFEKKFSATSRDIFNYWTEWLPQWAKMNEVVRKLADSN